MDTNFLTFASILPEITLATLALVLLMVGVFAPEKQAAKWVSVLASLGMLGAAYLAVKLYGAGGTATAFGLPGGNVFHVLDGLAMYSKALIAVGATACLAMAAPFFKHHKRRLFESDVLLVLSVLGMFVMVSAQDFLIFYLGLELMSFTLYILAAFLREDAKSTEAGLKYFVLGSLASGLVLFGISLLYGLAGGLGFETVALALQGVDAHQPAVAMALVLVLVAIAFKVSAAPFHMWTPDVYEGAPTPVTAFMAVVPKAAAVVLLIRLLYEPLAPLMAQWKPILMMLAVATMAVGAVLAIVQENIKRLLAYSSIGHVGFLLVGLAAGTQLGVTAVLAYVAIYAAMTAGAFAILLTCQKRGVYVENISDLAGFASHAPWRAALLLIFMFSLAGVPPFAGFFAKFLVFQAAVEAGLIWLALTGVLLSVVGAYYVLKVIKALYFEEGGIVVEAQVPTALKVVVAGAAILTIGLGLFPDLISIPAAMAAQSLF